MVIWPSFCIFLIALLCAMYFVILRYDIILGLRIFGIGIVLADFLLLLHIIPLLQSDAILPTAFMNMVQLVTIDADYGALMEASHVEGGLWFFTMLCVLSPLVCGGIVLTFFEDASGFVRYHFFKWFFGIYFFSELNEHSLALAKNLYERDKKFLFIFCNASILHGSDFSEEAEKYKFIVTKKSEMDFVRGSRHWRYYFEASDNQDVNLDHTMLLLSLYMNLPSSDYSKVKVFLFSEQEEAQFLLSSIDKKGFPVMIVDRDRFAIYRLLFDYPLYCGLSRLQKMLSVVIMGAGRIGMEMLHAVLWCGCLGKEYPLKVTVLDKNASHAQEMFYAECPGLLSGEYNVTFVDCDVTTICLTQSLDSYCADAQYICVCLGDDELDIHVALSIRAYYLRVDVDFVNEPFIAVHIRNDVKSRTLSRFARMNHNHEEYDDGLFVGNKSGQYHLHSFGNYGSIYSASFIVDSELEQLAQNVHVAYERAFSNGAVDMLLARTSYYASEVNARSDRANALHIRYKLWMLGFGMKRSADASEQELLAAQPLAETFCRMLQDEEVFTTLMRIEHDRWNAFMLSEGWLPASIEQAERYMAGASPSHKHVCAKLHACICPWEELDAVAQHFDPQFKEYDARLIRDIPVLLGLKNDTGNISAVSYILTKNR